MQSELPRANIGGNAATDAFMEQELVRINNEYGNYPSFILMSMGNELGNSEAIEPLMETAKDNDNRRRFYVASCGHGPQSELDDFRVIRPGLRGIIGASTHTDFGERAASFDLPIVAHEVGQNRYMIGRPTHTYG